MRTGKPNIIREKFHQYYQTYSKKVQPPSAIRQREFGFILLDKKIMLRHKSFGDDEVLRSFLTSTIPSDAYYSAAHYGHPESSMDEKEWLGADLVFDIDADHILTSCGKVHDSWKCTSCGFGGKGPSPERCPACGETKFDTQTWTCDDCLVSAKEEAIKLLEMLLEDFGFAEQEMKVYFSGNRGYHVHVESEEARMLDSMARKEIVDYVIGLGMKTGAHELIEKGTVTFGSKTSGWGRRIAVGIETFLTNVTPIKAKALGLSKHEVNFLTENKELLLQNLKDKGSLDVKEVGPKNLQRIIQLVVAQQSAQIDTVVTTDIHRLIRLAGSLHGKTGLMKTEASFSNFDSFDPLKDAVAFKEGEIVVEVAETPGFRIGDGTYGPFKEARVELPTAAAMFLLCMGAAQVVEK